MGLPWFRMDSNIASHPRILDLLEHGTKGRAAAFAFVCSIGYCTDHGTDGHIKRGALPLMHATAADAKLLISVGLWSATETGYVIPDWADRQQTRETTEAIRSARAAAGRKGAEKRWGKTGE